MSLVISLACALLATLLEQWARRYLKVTQPRYSPHKRARIRAFFFEGVEKFFLPWSGEALPALLHASLFLFFAGMVVFLFNANFTIFKLVLSWVGVCTSLYGCITFVPIFRHDSPYYTPLTSLAWPIVIGISYVVFRVLRWFTGYLFFGYSAFRRFQSLEGGYRKLLVQGMQKTAEEIALYSPSKIDTRAFLWTFDSLDEDHELERFFSGLPGFCSSKVVDDPLPSLTEEGKTKLSETLIGFLNRTFSSDLLPEPVKSRRAAICAKALDLAKFPNDCLNEETVSLVQAMVTGIVARAQWRDDSWFILASSELGVPETVLRDYAAHGHSLSLAILVHTTRQHFSHTRGRSWPWFEYSKVLETASKFNVQDTSPELQHEFCALWNQIVLKAQNDHDRLMAFHTLRPIRNVYIALHRDTDSAPTRFSPSTRDWDNILIKPSSYPVCTVAGHIHEDSTSTTIDRSVLQDKTSLARPDVPSSPVPAPLRVVESLTDVLPLDNFHAAHHTAIKRLRIPVTSLGPAPAGAIPDIVTFGITMPHPIPGLPLSSTSPPAALAV